MKEKGRTDGYLTLNDAPGIAGLRFRRYRGEEDLPAMLAVIEGSRVEDRDDWVETLDNLTLQYRHLINCDPYRDLLLVELQNQIVGYSRVFWVDEAEGNRLLIHLAKLLPETRGMGIRQAMMRWNEARLAEVRGECGRLRPHEGPVLYQASASDAEPHWASLLEGAGYRVVRYGFEMVRPDLEAIPDLPLPVGLEVRPVTTEQLPAIWAAAREAFRDHWGYCEDEFGEDQYRSFAEWAAPFIDTFQVAWSGDEVAGMVQCFIDPEQNEVYGRRRGWTEGICVRRPWRRQGLARALIARSLQVCRVRGMDHAGLGVDAENPNGAVQLYRGMGFEVVKTHSTYRKRA